MGVWGFGFRGLGSRSIGMIEAKVVSVAISGLRIFEWEAGG